MASLGFDDQCLKDLLELTENDQQVLSTDVSSLDDILSSDDFSPIDVDPIAIDAAELATEQTFKVEKSTVVLEKSAKANKKVKKETKANVLKKKVPVTKVATKPKLNMIKKKEMVQQKNPPTLKPGLLVPPPLASMVGKVTMPTKTDKGKIGTVLNGVPDVKMEPGKLPQFLAPPAGCPMPGNLPANLPTGLAPNGQMFPMLPNMSAADTKRAKKQRRLIRNRMSAQLHRERKKQYVKDLEKQVTDLQKDKKCLESKVTALEDKNAGLTKELQKVKEQLAQQHQHCDNSMIDLSMLNDDYLSSPLSMDSEPELSSEQISTQSTSANGQYTGAYSPVSDVSTGRSPKRAKSSSMSPMNKRKRSRPATAALCLAAVVLTVSVLNESNVLGNVVPQPNSATNGSPASLIIGNHVVGTDGTATPMLNEARLLNPPAEHQKNVDQHVLSNGGGVMMIGPNNKDDTVVEPSTKRKLLSMENADAREIHNKRKRKSMNSQNNIKAEKSTTASNAHLLALALSNSKKESGSQNDDHTDITAIKNEISQVARYLPGNSDMLSAPDQSVDSSSEDEPNNGLTIYGKTDVVHPRQSTNVKEKLQNHKTQRRAIQAAVRAYLAHVGADVDDQMDAEMIKSDSLIMCPQAYGVMSQLNHANKNNATLATKSAIRLRGQQSGNVTDAQSKMKTEIHQQNPYLTLFVPSNSIHAPQWGLNGQTDGYVQLGCKLDSIRPLYANAKTDGEGFRVL